MSFLSLRPTIAVLAMIAIFWPIASMEADVLPATLPPWPATWNLSASTLTMQCNGSGWSSPSRGAEFGVVSYDWSNAKQQWAMAQPMDCEERLLKQAEETKAAGGKHVFVYRSESSRGVRHEIAKPHSHPA